MKHSALEDLLSSASNTYACLVRAKLSMDRVKVTKRVREHLGQVHDVNTAVGQQLIGAIQTTGNAVHDLSDEWGMGASIIRGGETRLSVPGASVKGTYRGLWPSECSGHVLFLIEDATFDRWHLAAANSWSYAHDATYPGSGKKLNVPLPDVADSIYNLAQCVAFKIPCSAARRRRLQILNS